MAAECEIDGCERPREGRKHKCAAHQWRLRVNGDVMAHIPVGQLGRRRREPKPAEPTELEIAMAPAPAEGRGFLWLV